MFHHSLKRVLFLGGVVMGEFILQLPVFRKRQSKICILIGIDVLLIVFAYLLAFVFRYYIEGSSLYSIFQIFNDLKYELLIASIILITCQWIMKQYQSRNWFFYFRNSIEFICLVFITVSSTIISYSIGRYFCDVIL